MSQWFANAMEQIMNFSNILNASIAASWMVLAVIALRLVLKKAPRWEHVALWGLVAVRLLLPFSIESPFSLIPSTETVPQEILVYEGEALQAPASLDIVSNPVFPESVTVNTGETVDRVQVNMLKMTPIWIGGMVALFLYTAVSYWSLHRKVSEAVILRDNIYQSENVGSPFVLGMIKPKIYLPYHMDGQNLSHVVAHEQAHICRRDHWWKPLGFLLLTIHWFNPLMWLAYVLLCRDIELACDEKVIKELGNEQRADYTQALVACSVGRRMIAACPLAFGEVGVKERVKSVMNYKKPAFWVIIMAVIVCVGVAVCFLTNPKQDSYTLRIVVPAGSQAEFVYTDEEVSTIRNSIKIWSGDGLGDTEVLLSPVNETTETGYTATYLTHGMPVEFDAEKDTWFQIGVNMQNPTNEDIIVYVEVENVEVRIVDEINSVIEWFDYTENPSAMDDESTINLPIYPNVTFSYNQTQIIASKPFDSSELTGHTILITGMPIWNAYFTDLTGDDYPEICATYTYGSGIIDSRIIIYDYANGASYELSDRGDHDFTLRFDEESGRLWVDKKVYNSDELVSSGYLVFSDGCLQIAEDSSVALDAAISNAILDHYRRDEADGLIHVESHVLLANETMSGTPQPGAANHMEKTTVYLLVFHEKYSTYGGTLEAVGGSYVPAALTFKISGSGEYILEEYWEPRDGGYYVDDVRDKFPGTSADDALNDQAYIEDLEAQNHNKALAYMNSTGSMDTRIAELLDGICTSPGTFASEPEKYLEAHETAYQELLGYGEFTLRYCFDQFLMGNQTDLRESVMARACEDISLSWGEALLIDGPAPTTGQAWFDVFCSNAESLAGQLSEEELEKHYPATWLFLQLIGKSSVTIDAQN